MRLFCFGFGYTAEALARRLSARTTALAGTRTSLAGDAPLGAKLAEFKGDGASVETCSLLAGTTIALISIPPDLEGDAVLRHFRDELAALPVEVELDEAGNQWASLAGDSERAVLIGGHLDSVPNGGWLDGCLNVLAGLEVLRRLAEGKVYKQIAHELTLSTSTVRTHLHNIYGKLGAVDRAQAVLIATERGWL